MTRDELIAKIEVFTEDQKEHLLTDIFELVSIRSVQGAPTKDYPFGEEPYRALSLALELSRKYGFDVKNYDNYIGAAYYGDQEKHIGIIGHVDVVPEASGWTYDPYPKVPQWEGAYLIGRGVSDDKGPIMMGLYAMRFFKEQNIPLKYGLRVLFGSDEETGMTDVEYYLKKERPPVFTMSPDSSFPVCHGEKGVYEANIISETLDGNISAFTGGVASNVVPDYAKVVLEETDADRLPAAHGITVTKEGSHTVIESKGTSRHASEPSGSINAIHLLCAYLTEHNLVTGTQKDYISLMSVLLSDYRGKHFGINTEEPVFGKLSCIGGMISYKNGIISQNINIRYPLSITGKELTQKISASCPGSTVEVTMDQPVYYIPADSAPIQVLLNAYKEVFDDPTAKPYVSGGGTYARKFPGQSAVAYGPGKPGFFSPFGESRGGAHQQDEAKEFKELLDGLKTYILAIYDLNQIDL